MNISLSWVFDYIDEKLSSVDIEKIVHLFNTHTAEIERFKKVVIPVESLYLVQIKTVLSQKIVAHCKELDKDVELSFRSDAVASKYYLILEKNKKYSWVSLSDFHSDKDGLFPAVAVSHEQIVGSWRNLIEAVDYIVDVDNKSINHRPDLWGHYGIAREIAAILNFKLKPLSAVLAKQSIVSFDKKSKKDAYHSLEIVIDDTVGCSRFAGLYCDTFEYQDSNIFIASRLARVGAKPIDAIVDLTNYVMFDIGHPMHVFDAKVFAKQQVIVRKACKDEKIVILDGQQLNLRPCDIVVANDQMAVALAGIMGGKDSGFTSKTKSLFIEAAHFDPTTIRTTAQHFKLRTEACTRFEKHIDPMQNLIALQRFLYLASEFGIVKKVTESIVSVGNIIEPASIIISHECIIKKIGIDIPSDFIITTLQKLGFEVSVQKKGVEISYKTLVPTNRMTKDISIKEDIVEEIVRMYGYDKITYQPVMHAAEPFDTHEIRNVSNIKRYVAFACKMHEVRDYLFFDEAFIKRLEFIPEQTIRVKNPESENWTRLVTSLVPHLIKNVEANVVHYDQLRFFEWNQIWHISSLGKMYERSSLAGIFFDKNSIDFYDVKQELQGLWDLLNLEINWSKPKESVSAWYDQHKVAELWVGKQCIGTAGMVSESFVKSVVQGQAFVFEIDGDYMKSLQSKQSLFKSWSKYQNVTYDISLLVPLKVTSDQLQSAISQADSKIVSVDLVDFFEKDEWVDRRALTFRYTMSDSTKTLEKKEIDAIVEQVEKSVKKYDVSIR